MVVVTVGNWAGSQKRPESSSHPQANPPLPYLPTQRHPSALPGCTVALCPGSCPGFDAVTGRVTLCVWPRACMLDVVIINALLSPLRRAVPKAGGTGGLWRGSRPGEQLCGLEAAGAPPHSPLRAPLHQPARRYNCFFFYRLSAQQVPGMLVDALSRILWNAQHKRLIKDLIIIIMITMPLLCVLKGGRRKVRIVGIIIMHRLFDDFWFPTFTYDLLRWNIIYWRLLITSVFLPLTIICQWFALKRLILLFIWKKGQKN